MLTLGLSIFALAWVSARAGCLVSALFILPCWISATLAAGETARFKRRAFITQYLCSAGRLARLLGGGWWLLAWQGVKALILTLVLMVGSLPLETGPRFVLLADLVLLPVILYLTGVLLHGVIREDIHAPMARHWAHWVNSPLLWLGLTAAILFSAQADYTGLPWQDVVRFSASQPRVVCEALGVLARFQGVGEALALWTAQNLFAGLERPQQVLLAWAAFSAVFGVSFLMAWGYSRVLIGAWTQSWWLPMLNQEHGHAAWLSARHELVRGQISEATVRDTDAVFAGAERRVPLFADWYFSLTGEYVRLFHAAAGDLPEFLERHLQALIFEPAGTMEAVDRLVVEMDRRLAEQMRGAAGEFDDMLTQLIRRHRLEAGPEPVKVKVEGDWTPSAGVEERLESIVSLSAGDIGRQGLATSAGVAVSVVAFKKLGATTVAKTSALVAAKQSAGMLAALAVKLGLKSAVKSGGALTGAGMGAASSAAICTGTVVGAPLAPACALVGGALTGVAAWLLVDKAILEADELMNREDLENHLHEVLSEQREELRAILETHFLEALGQGFAHLEQDLIGNPRSEPGVPKKDFVPVRAAGGG